MESFLDELDDSAPVVEYWSRQEWKHIEAHADVDEGLAAKTSNSELRYPEHGHVLYLSVGSRVRGPTCIWQPGKDGSRFGPLTTVPAVPGRVLRFDGSLQHAVPRPADVWLAPFVINQSGPASEFERSVVLFNTWANAECPPLGVQRVDGDEEAAASDGVQSEVRCTSRELWRAAPEHAPSGRGASGTMKLWLLGDTARRGQIERTIPLPVDKDHVLKALEEPLQCTHLETFTAPAA